MKKQSPKQPAKRNAKRPEPVATGAAAKQGETGAANHALYCREQVRRFITDLRKDCALICDAVKNSLYDDGAGLLEDEDLYTRLGRVAYIDNFIRYFGDYLTVEDTVEFLNDILPHGLQTAGGAVDMRQLERVPTVDPALLKDILDTGDDETSIHNLNLYIFALWVSFHVGAVVFMFRKWVEVYGENVPPMLRDMSALARCVCVYTRTADNANGGIFYDGGWFESFAMCGERRRKRNAAANETERGANPSAGDMAGGESVGVVNIKAGRVNVEGVTVAATEPERKAQKAGHKAGGVSQAIFAGFMGVAKKTVCRWENHPDKYPPPVVDGKTYEKGIRDNGAGAFMFAQRYKDTKRGAVKIIGGDGGAGIAEKQAAEKWIRDNAAALRSVGV